MLTIWPINSCQKQINCICHWFSIFTVGKLGPRQLGPGARLSVAQLSTQKKWQIGPQGPTVRPKNRGEHMFEVLLEANCWNKTIIYFLLFGESKKRVSLILRSWALCSRDGEIPLLVITMLFSYKGRGTRQIWWSLCLGADAQLSDLTWDIVQRFSTRQQPQSFHRVLSWKCCRKMMICHFIEAFKWCRILLLPSF